MIFHFVSTKASMAQELFLIYLFTIFCLLVIFFPGTTQIVPFSTLNSGHDAALCLWKENVKECNGAVRQRETLELSDHRGPTGRCWVREEVSLFKRRYLLKILSARYPRRSFPLGENGELTYGSQFNFISDPSGDRQKERAG